MARTTAVLHHAGQPIHRLGIDVATRDLNKLRKRLEAMAKVLDLRGAGAYRADQSYSQLWLDTYWTEAELDDWLYRVKHGCDYVGVFERGPEQTL